MPKLTYHNENSSKQKGISGCGVCIFGNTEDHVGYQTNAWLFLHNLDAFIQACITEQTGVKSIGGPYPKSQISAATHQP